MLDLAFNRLAGDGRASELLIVGPSLGTAIQPLWAACATQLSDRYEVVGWDLPGHGKSPRATTPFTIGDLAATVRAAATRQANGRPAWYAGVSLGGAVGFELAVHPGPFRGIATLGSAPKIGDTQGWCDRAQLVRDQGIDVMVAPSASRWFAPGFMSREPLTAKSLLDALRGAHSGSYAWACEALARFDRTDDLREIHARLLLATGVYDGVVTPTAAKAIADRTAGADFKIITNSGHLAPAEQPHQVAALLRDFTSRYGSQVRSQRMFGELHAVATSNSGLGHRRDS